jgi:hypothetical protein
VAIKIFSAIYFHFFFDPIQIANDTTPRNDGICVCFVRGQCPLRRYLQANTRLPPMRGKPRNAPVYRITKNHHIPKGVSSVAITHCTADAPEQTWNFEFLQICVLTHTA